MFVQKIKARLNISLLKEPSFLSHVFILMSGTALAQFFAFIGVFLLTKIYTPEDFGFFSIYVAVVTILGSIATGRYDAALMLSRDDEEVSNMFILSCLITFLFSITLFLIMQMFRGIDFFRQESLVWSCLLSLSVFFLGLHQTFFSWYNRKRHYLYLATNKAFQGFIAIGISCTIGQWFFASKGLIVGFLAGQFLVIIVFICMLRFSSIMRYVSWRKIIEKGKYFYQYPQKSTIAVFFNSSSYHLEYILLNFFYGLRFVGHFYFVCSIANAVNSLISGSLWQVFLASNVRCTPSEIFESLVNYQGKLLRYSTLFFYSSLFVASDIFSFFLGANWDGVSILFYPLIIAAHVNLIVSSFSLFILLNNPHAELMFNNFLLFSKVSVLVVISLLFKNPVVCVIAISVVQGILFMGLGCWNYAQLGKKYSYFLKMYFRELVFITPYLIALCILYLLTDGLPIRCIGVVLVNIVYLIFKNRSFCEQRTLNC